MTCFAGQAPLVSFAGRAPVAPPKNSKNVEAFSEFYARLADSGKPSFSAFIPPLMSVFWSYYWRVIFRLLLLLGVEGRFYPSGCGGHKNSENVVTFSEFLGGRKNLAPAPATSSYVKENIEVEDIQREGSGDLGEDF